MKRIRAKELEAELSGRAVTDAHEMGELAVQWYGAEAWISLLHPSELEELGEFAKDGRHRNGTWSVGRVVCTAPLVIADWPDLLEVAEG